MGDTEIVTGQALTAEAEAAQGVGGEYRWGEIVHGDCLEVMRGMRSEAVDLVYVDPPFFTQRVQERKSRAKIFTPTVASEDAAGTAPSGESMLRYRDQWQGGRHAYLEWLEIRVREIFRLLKSNGVLLLHLDWHAVHYAKVMCDGIFGDEGFQNELIWYYQTGGASKGRFSRKHDTILMYAKGADFYFDGKAVAIPRTAKAMKRARSGKGARIAATDTHKNPDDVIMIPALNPMAIERTGYPTQKPVALLEMLITALCPAGGGVADFFCGSGTTLAAAERVGRRWFGCDESAAAVGMARGRVREVVK